MPLSDVLEPSRLPYELPDFAAISRLTIDDLRAALSPHLQARAHRAPARAPCAVRPPAGLPRAATSTHRYLRTPAVASGDLHQARASWSVPADACPFSLSRARPRLEAGAPFRIQPARWLLKR